MRRTGFGIADIGGTLAHVGKEIEATPLPCKRNPLHGIRYAYDTTLLKGIRGANAVLVTPPPTLPSRGG